jgi:hypothetical protein
MIFEDVAEDDLDQLSEQHKVDEHIDMKSPVAVAGILADSLKASASLTHLQSILTHLMLVPGDRKMKPKRFKFIDQVIQQVAMQTDEGEDLGECVPWYSLVCRFWCHCSVRSVPNPNSRPRLLLVSQMLRSSAWT